MIGKVVSHYKIREHLGEGGMGVVYKADDTKLDRTVALKFLPSKYLQDKEKEARFIHEAKSASALDHPNICTIFEINKTESGELFIAMGCYDGKTLKQKIKEGPLDIKEAVNITLQIAKGLCKAHEKGIIHRDIKPGNIIFSDDGIVKILDFGLAKMAGVTMTTDGSTLGTVAYMSPEQATGGEVDHRSDIWALGILLYEMLTGGIPFVGDYPQALIYSIINNEPEDLKKYFPQMSDDFIGIINKILAKEPEDRYQHVNDIINDLNIFLRDFSDINDTITSSSIWKTTINRKQNQNIHKSTTIILTPNKRRLLIFSTIAFLALMVVLTILVSRFIYREDASELMADNPSIAVMYFNNRTDHEDLDKIVVDMLITNLSNFEQFEVISSQRLFDILKKSGNDKIINKNIASEIARKAKVDIMMHGSIIKIGKTIRINAQISNVKTGRNIMSEQVTGHNIDDLFVMVDELTQKIIRNIGITENEVVKISDCTTNSIQAYEYYVQGVNAYQQVNIFEALGKIQKAIDLDSTFASAYLVLSYIYENFGDLNERDKAIIKAKEFSKSSSRKEQLYITANYVHAIENNMLKRISILEQIAEEYPDDKQIHYQLGTIYFELGDSRSLSENEKALELDPDFGPALNALVYYYLKPEILDFDKALSYLRRYLKLYPNDANPHDTMGDIYFSMGRIEDAIEKYKDASRIDPGFSEFRIAYMYALLEEYNMAFFWVKRSIDMSPTDGVKATRHQLQGFLHYWLGEYSEAIENMQKSSEIFRTMNNNYKVAVNNFFLYMFTKDYGNIAKSSEYLKAMENYFDSNEIGVDNTLYLMFKILVDKDNIDFGNAVKKAEKTPGLVSNLMMSKKYIKFYYDYIFPLKMMEIGSEKNAIKFCEKNNKIKIRVPSQVETYIIYNLTRKNVLALSYYKNDELDKSIAEYEKILKINPDRNDLRLIHPSYHYELGVAYESKGEKAQALKEFKLFLQYWNIANQDQDVIKDVKKRIKKLSK